MKFDEIYLVSHERTHLSELSLDIHHDLDFDQEVFRNAEKLYRLGFRSVEHHRP